MSLGDGRATVFRVSVTVVCPPATSPTWPLQASTYAWATWGGTFRRHIDMPTQRFGFSLRVHIDDGQTLLLSSAPHRSGTHRGNPDFLPKPKSSQDSSRTTSSCGRGASWRDDELLLSRWEARRPSGSTGPHPRYRPGSEHLDVATMLSCPCTARLTGFPVLGLRLHLVGAI